MDAQAWAWLIFIVGQVAIIPTSVRLHRAQDPRDGDGRKVPVDAARVASAKRVQAWALGFWGACVLASCAIRVIDAPDLLPGASVALGSAAIVLAVTTWVARRRARRRAGLRDTEAG